MSGDEAMKRNLAPMCRFVAAATAGVDPSVMGTGPIPAVRSAVAKAGWSLDDVDLFELNEAFAAQAIAVQRELNIPEAKVRLRYEIMKLRKKGKEEDYNFQCRPEYFFYLLRCQMSKIVKLSS